MQICFETLQLFTLAKKNQKLYRKGLKQSKFEKNVSFPELPRVFRKKAMFGQFEKLHKFPTKFWLFPCFDALFQQNVFDFSAKNSSGYMFFLNLRNFG